MASSSPPYSSAVSPHFPLPICHVLGIPWPMPFGGHRSLFRASWKLFLLFCRWFPTLEPGPLLDWGIPEKLIHSFIHSFRETPLKDLQTPELVHDGWEVGSSSLVYPFFSLLSSLLEWLGPRVGGLQQLERSPWGYMVTATYSLDFELSTQGGLCS